MPFDSSKSFTVEENKFDPNQPFEREPELHQGTPQIDNPWVRYPAMLGSTALHGALVTAGIPGDIESGLMRGVVNPLVKYFGGTPEDPNRPDATFFPTSGQLVDAGTRAGLINRADLLPGWGAHPGVEHGIEAIGTGTGAVAPLAVLGPTGEILPTLAAGATGAAAGEGARALEMGPTAQVAAGALAGAPVQAATSWLRAPSLIKLQTSLGTSTTWQEAGTKVQDAANTWLRVTKPQQEADILSGVNFNDPASVFAANDALKKLQKVADDHIEPLATAAKPEKAADLAMKDAKKGGTTLSVLHANIPEATSELAAAHLSDGGKLWKKLSPEAKVAMVPDAVTRARIEDALPTSGGLTTPVHQLGTMLTGTSLGAATGVIGQHFLGGDPGHDLLLGGATGEIIGLLAPMLARGAGSVYRNPSVLRGGLAGGLGAAPNALYPGPVEP